MKYKTIDELNDRIERTIKKTVKHYYTDWKNYDRPKYISYMASGKAADHDLILIARECGTYLLKQSDIDAGDEWTVSVYNYFKNIETAHYFRIDIDHLTFNAI